VCWCNGCQASYYATLFKSLDLTGFEMNGSVALRFALQVFALFAHLLFTAVFACTAKIKSEWTRFGFTNNTEDVKSVVAALDGTGQCVRLT